MAAGWPDKDDQELLALIQDGSHQAFAELVQRHTERFYRLAYRYAQNRERRKTWSRTPLLVMGKSGKLAAGSEQQVYHMVLSHCGEFMPRLAKEKTTYSPGRKHAVGG
jgi:hypothetical protein